MKTKEQIDTEIETLRKMKPNVRRRSAFGDDHHHAIEAQMSVLREMMSTDNIYDAYGDESADEFEQNVLDEAINARDWMMGELAEDNAPSAGWAGLVA